MKPDNYWVESPIKKFVLNENSKNSNSNFIEAIRKHINKKIQFYSDSTIIVNPNFSRIKVNKYFFGDSLNLIKKVDYEIWRGNKTGSISEWYDDGVKKSYKRFNNDTVFFEQLLNRDEFGRIISIYDISKLKDTVLTSYKYLNDSTVLIKKSDNSGLTKIVVNRFAKPIRYSNLTDENTKQRSSEYKYDINGNNIYWKSIVDNKVNGETIYKYDSLNRVIEQIDFLKSEDNYSNHEKFRYNKEGKIVYHWQINQYGDTLLRLTDIIGNQESWKQFENNELKSYGEIVYNNDKKLLSGKTFEGNLVFEQQNEYNSEGKIIKETKFQNNVKSSEIVYKWFMIDENKSKLEEYRDNELYQITFYENE